MARFARMALLACMLATISACGAGLIPVLAAVSQGAQLFGALLDVAAGGVDMYYARHPDPSKEAQLKQAIQHARVTKAAVDALLTLGEALDEGDLREARDREADAYEAVYELLKDYGILDATPPPGGAETDAPLPQPLELPTPEELRGLI